MPGRNGHRGMRSDAIQIFKLTEVEAVKYIHTYIPAGGTEMRVSVAMLT